MAMKGSAAWILAMNSSGKVVYWAGVTTTPISDGSTTNPVMINGSSVTIRPGGAVGYNGNEFVLSEDGVWQEFGETDVQHKTLDTPITVDDIEVTTVEGALSAINEYAEDIEDALDGKVDKVAGKGLSTNDYTDGDKEDVAKVDGLVSSVGGLTSRVGITESKVGTLEGEMLSVQNTLDTKVEKITGKGLSTNDYSNADKAIVDGVTTALAGKVDKVTGKGLSTNDYTNEDKAKVDSLGTASAKNSTSVVTDSTDLVESGAVKDIVGWGNKNKLRNNAVSTSKSGVDFTVNNNKSITLSGSATANWAYEIYAGSIDIPVPSIFSIGAIRNASSVVYVEIDGTNYYIPADKEYVEIPAGTLTKCRIDGNQYFAPATPITYSLMICTAEEYAKSSDYEPYHESVEQTLRDAEVIEGKNLLPNDATSQTINGVTFTVNSDGSVTANGTATANTFFNILVDNNHTNSLNGKILTGCPSNGGNSSYRLDISNVDVTSESDVGGGKTITIDTTGKIIVGIRIASGYTANNLVFYPMISKDGGAYEPYYTPLKDVVSNKCDNTVIAPVENGSTASQAYAVGDYFIKDDSLGKTKAPIASGGTFTKDTNYEKTNVAKEITELYKYIGILTTPVEAFTANSLPMLKRNITNAFYNGSLRAEIAAGNFKNVRPGDYIIGQATGSIYYVAECDYWLGNGDNTNNTNYPAYGTHHLGLMLFKPVGTTALWRGYGYSDKSWRVSSADLGRCPWNADTTVDPTDTEAIGSNSTNITRSYNGTNMSAYMGSFIRERIDAILLPQCFQADFGSENVLKRRNWLSNAINTSAISGARSDWQGIASGSVWVDRFIDLASEVELYGSRINSSSRDDVGVQNKQLAIYRNGRIHDFYPRMDLWTKGVASATTAALRNSYGIAGAVSASLALWACPLGCVR